MNFINLHVFGFPRGNPDDLTASWHIEITKVSQNKRSERGRGLRTLRTYSRREEKGGGVIVLNATNKST